MGLGIGIDCVRCGKQLAYEQPEFFDEEHKLCGYCVSDIRKNNWDEKNQDIIKEIKNG